MRVIFTRADVQRLVSATAACRDSINYPMPVTLDHFPVDFFEGAQTTEDEFFDRFFHTPVYRVNFVVFQKLIERIDALTQQRHDTVEVMQRKVDNWISLVSANIPPEILKRNPRPEVVEPFVLPKVETVVRHSELMHRIEAITRVSPIIS